MRKLGADNSPTHPPVWIGLRITVKVHWDSDHILILMSVMLSNFSVWSCSFVPLFRNSSICFCCISFTNWFVLKNIQTNGENGCTLCWTSCIPVVRALAQAWFLACLIQCQLLQVVTESCCWNLPCFCVLHALINWKVYLHRSALHIYNKGKTCQHCYWLVVVVVQIIYNDFCVVSCYVYNQPPRLRLIIHITAESIFIEQYAKRLTILLILFFSIKYS